MNTNESKSKKSEELRDSELSSAAGGAGKRHPGQVWEPHMGDIEPGAPKEEPGPIQHDEETGLPDDGSR